MGLARPTSSGDAIEGALITTGVYPTLIDEPWYLRFHDLMPFRVREILLVSSPYDAFILEEDGRLSARLFMEYSELNLSHAPRIIHAPTGWEAMDLLRQRRFDLVITMVHLADMDVSAFARQVKMLYPRLPVALFVFAESDIENIDSDIGPSCIDRVFSWTGDAHILIAAIKLIEDHKNLDHDTQMAGVRMVLVVEDSVRRYSSFLSLLYTELLSQAGSLIAEGVNPVHKLMRMRARPKIVLATTFEEAISYYRKYSRYVFAVISDVRFPKNGVLDPGAGIEMASIVRQDDPDLPMLLQSADSWPAEQAEQLGVGYVAKNSPHLLRDIRGFLTEGLGFGDFIFRLPDRAEVGRARSMYEMEQILANVPAESLEYHARRNHFSLWLTARSMLRLAERLKSRRFEDFPDIESLRHYLIEVLRQARLQEQEGTITDFASRHSESKPAFLRMGEGSIGGKGRSLAFVNSLLVREGLAQRFEGLEIRIPRTIVIGTDEFDRFIEQNQLDIDPRELDIDREAIERFLAATLPADTRRDLAIAATELDGPIAVRSSTMQEDSHMQPFAGIYATYILPNNHPDEQVRLEQLCKAIKAVYSSIFWQNAQAYSENTPFSTEETKMGVVIQQLVGQRYGDRFYPHFSGVALSYNYYPIREQRPEQGLVAVALGLGHAVVLGETALQFCPSTPRILSQLTTPQQMLRSSQTTFYALDLSRDTVDFFAPPESTLVRCELDDAEQDGTLAVVGSVYSADDDTVRDTLAHPGPRLVTFNNVLRWECIPLAPALEALLDVLRQGVGSPAEIEFAVDMGDWGRAKPGPRRTPSLYVLQVRPQASELGGPVEEPQSIAPEQLLCRTTRALGHGVIDDIRDVIYVPAGAVGSISTREVADQVGTINAQLRRQQRPYLLIGPGRWGSAQPELGIPVEWSQISAARVIVETGFDDRPVEPSQGSHFFHNIAALSIGYLTLRTNGRDTDASDDELFDRAFLEGSPAVVESPTVRHLRYEKPLTVFLDAPRKLGLILKPGWADRASNR